MHTIRAKERSHHSGNVGTAVSTARKNVTPSDGSVSGLAPESLEMAELRQQVAVLKAKVIVLGAYKEVCEALYEAGDERSRVEKVTQIMRMVREARGEL